MSRTQIIVWAVLGALIAGAVWWWHATFVRVPAKIMVGASGEARLKPFLAAERFAARMGFAAKELRSLPDIDALAAGGVLLLPNRRQSLDPQRVQRIGTWVQNGGHLIVEAEALGVPDPVFDLLAVQRVSSTFSPAPVIVQLGDRVLTLPLNGHSSLVTPTGRLLLRGAIGEAVYLAAFTRGRGVVTVITSLDFARNPQIGKNDHAEALWGLMRLTPATHLAIYRNPVRLSLWGFLEEYAFAVLLASAALLVAWLWRVAPRFGPVAPDAPPARRRLLDHLRASGRYFWSLDLRERLLVAARDAALRRVLRAQPEFAGAKPQERAAHLATLAGVSIPEAQRLLDAGGKMRGAAFIQIMQTAQRVHAALERGNR
jgi:hypothetical protein